MRAVWVSGPAAIDVGQVGDRVEVDERREEGDFEAEGSQAGFLGPAGAVGAHGQAPEHPPVGAAEADGPPPAVGRMAQGGGRGVERAQGVVEVGRGHLGGVHADLHARPAGPSPRRG